MDKKFKLPKGKNRFTDSEAALIIKSTLEAIAYIHDKDITHRDLKPQNMLVKDQNDLSTIKVIDFGLGDKAR